MREPLWKSESNGEVKEHHWRNNKKKILKLDALKRVRWIILLYLHISSPKATQLSAKRGFLVLDFYHEKSRKIWVSTRFLQQCRTLLSDLLFFHHPEHRGGAAWLKVQINREKSSQSSKSISKGHEFWKLLTSGSSHMRCGGCLSCEFPMGIPSVPHIFTTWQVPCMHLQRWLTWGFADIWWACTKTGANLQDSEKAHKLEHHCPRERKEEGMNNSPGLQTQKERHNLWILNSKEKCGIGESIENFWGKFRTLNRADGSHYLLEANL